MFIFSSENVIDTMKVKEMSFEQRPREKALQFGLDTLSDLELVALLLQSGSKDRSVFDLAQDVLKESEGLSNLFGLHVNTLMQIKGIKKVKALQLLASIELCKRAMRAKVYRMQVHSAIDLVDWFKVEYGSLSQEVFVVVYLNVKGYVIHHKVLSKGTLDEATVHPRDIFKEAYLQNASSIICIHNHPSQDPTPSQEDHALTKKIGSIANMTGIQFLDHIVVGKDAYYSFLSHQCLY